MAYDKAELAAWWHGAEAAPPMPDGPGPWTLTGTAYGWEWRRAEEAPPGSDTVLDPGGALLVLHPDGDVRSIQWATFLGAVGVSPMPDGPPPIHGDLCGGTINNLPVGTLATAPADLEPIRRAEYGWVHDLTAPARGVLPGSLAPPAVVPGDAAVRIAVCAPDGSPLEPAPAAPDALFEAQVAAATHAFDRWRGSHHLDLMAAALKAALDVPDPRREAERRVVEAARRFDGSHDGNFVPRLAALRDALAALDAGPPG